MTTRVAIRFVDDNGKPTDDYIVGIPVVAVNIYVCLTYQSTPGQVAEATKLMKRFDALVDTGANTTMITKGVAGNLTPLRAVPTQNQAEPGIGSVYCGFRRLRPGNPIERGHAFRSKAATFSDEGDRAPLPAW